MKSAITKGVIKLKTIPININNADYEWLSVQAKQRKMTVATIVEEVIRDAGLAQTKKRNSVKALQEFLSGPPALTREEGDLLNQIIQLSREGKVIPPEMLRV